MKRIFKVLLLVIFLTSCSAHQSTNQSQVGSGIASSEELTNDTEQSNVLDVSYYSNKNSINDTELSKLYAELFTKIWDITESTDGVICLPDPGDQYEVAAYIGIQSESKLFRYHGTGTFAGYDDKKNATYITLLDGNDKKGYLVLDGTEFLSEVEGFITAILKFF